MATSTSHDSDFDPLISSLAAPLLPGDRAAFRAAAESALAGCSGEGAAYRILAPLWRTFFRPPPDDIRREGARHHRSSKLIQAEPIGAEDPRTGARDRHRLQVD
jgi:hypothetical protein